MLLQIRRDAFPGIEPYYTHAPSPADHADDVAMLHAKATALSSLQQLAAHPALVRLQPQAAKFVELGPLYVLLCVCLCVMLCTQGALAVHASGITTLPWPRYTVANTSEELVDAATKARLLKVRSDLLA